MTEPVKPKAPPVPKKPVTPPKAPSPVVESQQPQPVSNVLTVRHRETGKIFEVSRRYYETYRSVLEVV